MIDYYSTYFTVSVLHNHIDTPVQGFRPEVSISVVIITGGWNPVWQTWHQAVVVVGIPLTNPVKLDVAGGVRKMKRPAVVIL